MTPPRHLADPVQKRPLSLQGASLRGADGQEYPPLGGGWDLRPRVPGATLDDANKALQADIAAGKTFTDSAKAQKLALASPAAFSIYSVPETLNGVNENTGLLIEAAGVGKLTSAIRTANGDHVFIRPAKKDLTEDKTGAEEARLLVQRVSQRNAYFTGIGLVQDVVPAPVQAK